MTISITTCSVFWGGNIAEKEETNRPFQLVMDILHYYIWTSKLEKSPSKTKNFGNGNDTISCILAISTKINDELNTCPLFRHQRQDEHP